jgi:hypothetical protein
VLYTCWLNQEFWCSPEASTNALNDKTLGFGSAAVTSMTNAMPSSTRPAVLSLAVSTTAVSQHTSAVSTATLSPAPVQHGAGSKNKVGFRRRVVSKRASDTQFYVISYLEYSSSSDLEASQLEGCCWTDHWSGRPHYGFSRINGQTGIARKTGVS